jgi:3-methyladenine DNA glycosylase AlkD
MAPRSKRAKKTNAPPTLKALRKELYGLANLADAKFLQGFFKTGPGQYGAGDKFLGLRVPALRRLARDYAELSRDDVLQMLASSWHEERLLALVLMVDAYQSGDAAERKLVHRDYLANTRYINNWDLVDASAAGIVGAHLSAGDIALLVGLARSKDLWERRIAIVATHYFIKRDRFGPTLIVAELLLRDSHDLIHKAVGWMLREVGKRDRKVLDGFLREHYHGMPRTMLRYAIERHPEEVRRKYLAGSI